MRRKAKQYVRRAKNVKSREDDTLFIVGSDHEPQIRGYASALRRCAKCGELVEGVYEGDGCCEECSAYSKKKRYIKPDNEKVYAYGDGSGRIENFVIDGRKYDIREIYDILREHKAKEDADPELIVCERCGKKYKDNSKVNMVSANLEEDVKPGQAIGYMTTPFINGIQILSTCGRGAKIKMCDDCIEELVSWLFEIKVEDE